MMNKRSPLATLVASTFFLQSCAQFQRSPSSVEEGRVKAGHELNVFQEIEINPETEVARGVAGLDLQVDVSHPEGVICMKGEEPGVRFSLQGHYDIVKCRMTEQSIDRIAKVEISYSVPAYDINTQEFREEYLADNFVSIKEKLQRDEYDSEVLRFITDYAGDAGKEETFSVRSNVKFDPAFQVEKGELVLISEMRGQVVVNPFMKPLWHFLGDQVLYQVDASGLPDWRSNKKIFKKGRYSQPSAHPFAVVCGELDPIGKNKIIPEKIIYEGHGNVSTFYLAQSRSSQIFCGLNDRPLSFWLNKGSFEGVVKRFDKLQILAKVDSLINDENAKIKAAVDKSNKYLELRMSRSQVKFLKQNKAETEKYERMAWIRAQIEGDMQKKIQEQTPIIQQVQVVQGLDPAEVQAMMEGVISAEKELADQRVAVAEQEKSKIEEEKARIEEEKLHAEQEAFLERTLKEEHAIREAVLLKEAAIAEFFPNQLQEEFFSKYMTLSFAKQPLLITDSGSKGQKLLITKQILTVHDSQNHYYEFENKLVHPEEFMVGQAYSSRALANPSTINVCNTFIGPVQELAEELQSKEQKSIDSLHGQFYNKRIGGDPKSKCLSGPGTLVSLFREGEFQFCFKGETVGDDILLRPHSLSAYYRPAEGVGQYEKSINVKSRHSFFEVEPLKFKHVKLDQNGMSCVKSLEFTPSAEQLHTLVREK